MSARILIVDDVATNRIVLKVRLTEACYETRLAGSGAECLRAAREDAPDLILLDRGLPDLDGIDVLSRLRADASTQEIPVVATLGSADGAARLAALQAGADDVMTKPLDEARLMARIRALLRARDGADELRTRNAALGAIGMAEAAAPFERPGTIALIGDRPDFSLHLRKTLSTHIGDRLLIQSRDEALGDQQVPIAPDVYVIQADIGDEGGGLRLMSDLRSRGPGRHAGMCILLPAGACDRAAVAFDLGADDVIACDADPREIALRLRRLTSRKRRQDRLRATVSDGLRLAVIDPLTGVHNLRHARAQLDRIADRARRNDTGFAVMVVDVDRFKSVNDGFGHPAGDSVLIEVARRLSANLRQNDLLARQGGDEFLVALPETTLPEARRLAQRLCRAIEETAIAIDAHQSLSVTVSIGLAAAAGQGDIETPSAIVEKADRALLNAKSAGRNQVTVGLTAA